MVNKRYIPDAGDFIWIDFDSTKGHEQGKLRPTLVLSSKAYNKNSSLIVVCPITSKSKGYPFEVAVSSKKISGVVLSDQIRTIDWNARSVQFISRSPSALLEQVRCRIHALIF